MASDFGKRLDAVFTSYLGVGNRVPLLAATNRLIRSANIYIRTPRPWARPEPMNGFTHGSYTLLM